MKRPKFKQFKGPELINKLKIVGIISINEELNISQDYQRPGYIAAFLIGFRSNKLEGHTDAARQRFKEEFGDEYGKVDPKECEKACHILESYPYVYCSSDDYSTSIHTISFIISDGEGWLPVGPINKYRHKDRRDWDRNRSERERNNPLAIAGSFCSIRSIDHEDSSEIVLNDLKNWNVIRTPKSKWTHGKLDRRAVRENIRAYIEELE